MKVRDLMSTQVTSIEPEAELSEALQIMLWSAIRHLPVVREGRVVGILSHRDILTRRGGNGTGWRLLGTGAPAAHSPHLRFGFTLDTRRAERELGFTPSDRVGLARAGDGALQLETTSL